MIAHPLELVVIDDEVRVANALSREIGLAYGEEKFGIRSFTKPEQCVSYVKEHLDSTFLVISDLRMPEMNGSEVLRQVREISTDIQTILLTAYVDIDDIQKAVSTSLQTLLFKPWNRASLCAEIDKALETWSLRRENARLKYEKDQLLRTAGEFQNSLFTSTIPVTDRISFDAVCFPKDSIHCGGDFYRIIENKTGGYLVVMGDVVGHGPKAALVTTMVNTLLMGLELERSPILAYPADLLGFVNFRLCGLLESAPEMIVSLTALYINPATRQCIVAVAGQPPVYVRANHHVRQIKSSNPVLGFFSGASFSEVQFELGKDEEIIMFTDGLTESVPSRLHLNNEEISSILMSHEGVDTEVLSTLFRMALPEDHFSDDVTLIRCWIP